MAKNMALIENGTVTNIIWCSDREQETESLIDYGELAVAIGDNYNGEAFYRDGEKLLTPYESLKKQNAELIDTMAAMIEEVYQSDLNMMEE